MEAPKTWRGIVRRFEEAPKEIQKYFEFVPKLAEQFPLEVCLSYMFSRLELAHLMTIYCGIVKLHRAEASLVWRAVYERRFTRKDFRGFFRTVYSKNINNSVYENLEFAEKVRDNVIHGKYAKPEEQRKAIVNILKYAEDFNIYVFSLAGFKPFGKLQGFKGNLKPLDKSTTRWILKGMGF